MIPYKREEVVFQVKGLSVSYDRPILRNLDMTLKNVTRAGVTQGQVVALLGPSGKGKSQFLNCAAGLQVPNAGEVFLLGEETTALERVTRPGLVGVVPQNYLLFRNRTVLSNLLVAARMHQSDKAKALEEVFELLELFGLSDHIKKYPEQLSGGMRQRVSILQQILCRRHVMFMDEPFSGLDPVQKASVMRLIQQTSLRNELNTIILTTHDIESAVAIADLILLLGNERDANDTPIPGARIVGEYDIAALGLAWNESIGDNPEFFKTVSDIKKQFLRL